LVSQLKYYESSLAEAILGFLSSSIYDQSSFS
jgi:hypothetical protein